MNASQSESKNAKSDDSKSDDSLSRSKRHASTGRQLAEWVTLLASSVLVFGLAGFLVVQALQPHSKYVPVRATPRFEHIEKQGKQYFLPIEVENRGRRTIREVNIEVKWSEAGKPQSRDVPIDYLGEQSSQTAIVIFDADPKLLRIQAAPTYYRLD